MERKGSRQNRTQRNVMFQRGVLLSAITGRIPFEKHPVLPEKEH